MLLERYVGVCSSGGTSVLSIRLTIFLLILLNPLSAELMLASSTSGADALYAPPHKSQLQSRSTVRVYPATTQLEKRQWYPRLHHDAHLLGIPGEQPSSELVASLLGPPAPASLLRGRSVEPQSHPPNIGAMRFSSETLSRHKQV